MNEANLKILNAIPLVDVMRGWGHVVRRYSNSGKSAWFVCPWHDDHRPSLEVRTAPIKNATDLSFKCHACGETGFGAIQLAARLMGFAAGRVPDEDMDTVLTELMERCEVDLEPEPDGGRRGGKRLRVSIAGWDEFREAERQYADWTGEQPSFERGEWTEQGLKALGLKVELATHRARRSESDKGKVSGESSAAAIPAADVKVGDIITEFDENDTLQPLYRCSFGKDFYRGDKAEKKTIRAWGEEVERLFGVEPIARFVQRVEPEKGGAVVRIVRATRNYPMFIFRYPWGIKKYEPKDVYGNKWTWWSLSEDADLEHRWYADAALTDMLEGVVPVQDDRHPVIEPKKDKDGKEDKNERPRFKRVVVCSGPRDAIAVYSHSDAHVLWLHSELSGFSSKGNNLRPNRWMRSLLRKLQNVTMEGGLYVCYDEDETGISASQAIALNSPNINWLRLPKELTQIENGKCKIENPVKDGAGQCLVKKHLKDVTDFITRFAEVERLMPADLQHDDPCDWFENALFDTPSTKFWQWESERKEKDGTGRARYKFDLRNTPVFLRARGMVRKVMQNGKESFSRFFLLGNNKTYTECFPGEKGSPNKLVSMARDLMAEWLRAHKEHNDDKGALSRAIYSAKLDQGAMESIELMDFDEKSFGEDFDHFFFENCAVRVTKDKVEEVPYSSMKWWTNQEAVLDGSFEYVAQPWHVEVSPLYEPERLKHEAVMEAARTPEERAQENMRWDAWANVWKYRLVMDKPLEEMPLHFRFLYNCCRIFWEKEQGGTELTATERQVQDMYFITMLHALGSALVRHRSANRQQFIHITDNGTRREDLASGGTGKTAIMELLSLMRRVLSIDGKSLEGGNIMLEQELGKVVPGIHNIVCLDELPDRFSPKKLYNYPLGVTSRGLYHGSVRLTGDDLPKMVIASNEQIDLSSDSTSRRAYQVLVSDWYHPRSMDGSRQAHTPADDFRKEYGIKEVARNLPPKLLNEARNFLLGCVQLFLQLPDETLCPPRDSRALLRQALAASKDEQFTRWIASYLADKRHLGIPIAQMELAISLLDFCGITVGEKTITAAYNRIRNNLYDYIRTSVYVVDPPIVWKTQTDCENKFRRTAAWKHPMNADGTIMTDRDGNRLPRELDKKKQYRTYYFYHKSHVPCNKYDEAHLGDPDYVQPAPEKDPEAEVRSDK